MKAKDSKIPAVTPKLLEFLSSKMEAPAFASINYTMTRTGQVKKVNAMSSFMKAIPVGKGLEAPGTSKDPSTTTNSPGK